MKKLFTTLALASAFGFATNAQRSCDLTLTYVLPSEAFTFNCVSTDSVQISYLSINKGPDALLPGDSVWLFAPWHDEDYGTRWVLEEAVEAGDTFLTGGIKVNYAQIKRLADPSTGEWVYGGFTAGSTYIMGSVISNNAGASSTWVDPNDTNSIAAVSATWCTSSSIFESNNRLQSISVFPNPTTNTLNFAFDFEKASNATVNVYDVTGRLVVAQNFGKQNAGVQNFTLDVTGLANGNYTLELATDNNKGVSKFVIAK